MTLLLNEASLEQPKGRSKPLKEYFSRYVFSPVLFRAHHLGSAPVHLLRELPDVQAGFRKGRGTRDQIANIRWIIKKAREFQKNIYFCFIDYAKAFNCVDHNKLWKTLKQMGIPGHLTCLLRNLYAGQEATVRTGHGTTDWFQMGKGVRQGCILSPCLFNLYAEYIMRNAGLEEAQAGIKIARRNINNLRNADDTTLMAESEEELKSLFMKVKDESEKVGLKLNIQKTKIMASGPIISWEKDGETVETVSDFISLGSKITADGDCSHEIKRRLLLGRKAMTNLKAETLICQQRSVWSRLWFFQWSCMAVRVGL